MPNAQLSTADLPDIQGLVINGYSHMVCTRYLFLTIDQGTAASGIRKSGNDGPCIRHGASNLTCSGGVSRFLCFFVNWPVPITWTGLPVS